MKKVGKIKKGGKLGTSAVPDPVPAIQVKSFHLEMGQRELTSSSKARIKKKASLDKKTAVEIPQMQTMP